MSPKQNENENEAALRFHVLATRVDCAILEKPNEMNVFAPLCGLFRPSFPIFSLYIPMRGIYVPGRNGEA